MPPIPRAAESALRERDPLRLIIRSVAFIQQAVDEALDVALPTASGKTWAHGLPFPRKLEIVVALDILPPAARKGLAALAELRNEYAHDATPPQLTLERVDVVAQAWAELFPILLEDPAEEIPVEGPDAPDGIIAALMHEPAAIVKLKRVLYAAVLVAGSMHDRARQIVDDREAGRRNRLMRQYFEENRGAALDLLVQPPEQEQPADVDGI